MLGLAVLMLARILGMLYIKNNIEHQQIQERCTRQLPWNALIFLLFFLPFLIRLLVKDGFSTAAEAGMSAVSSGSITLESMKYLHNLLEMPILPVNQIPFLYCTLLDDLKMPKSTSTIPINNITSKIGISRRL